MKNFLSLFSFGIGALCFVSGPMIDARGVPFWLSLFVGNLVSTQLLGWWVVPAAFEGARCQNIENNPMQSSRRLPALEWQLDMSGKSGAFLHCSAIL